MKVVVVLLAVVLSTVVWAEEKEVGYWEYNGKFHRAIAEADRIVIRDGGDVCCVSPEETLKEGVYFEVTDPDEIALVYSKLEFDVFYSSGLACDCCGHPGIDWYKGKTRLLITGLKHGSSFSCNGGDTFVSLTKKSARWLRAWLLSHGLTEEQIK